MPWISKKKLDQLELESALHKVEHDAVVGARRAQGRLASIIHRQRLVIRNLKTRTAELELMAADKPNGKSYVAAPLGAKVIYDSARPGL